MSIFVCPDCGFKDSSIWRACSWLKYGVYTSFDEFQVFFPELAKQLAEIKATVPKGKARLENGSYVYRLTRNNFVYRMTKEIVFLPSDLHNVFKVRSTSWSRVFKVKSKVWLMGKSPSPTVSFEMGL